MIKGNVVVGQSGGPTSVINSSLAGVFKAAKELGAEHIYGMVHGIKGLLNEDLVDLSEKLKRNMDIELLKRTPSSFLGSCRYKLKEGDKEQYARILEILNKYNIKYFFYIGGNDSMDTIKQLSTYGIEVGSDIRFMGVPKTIDNDLAVTDHTPGFGSAAKYIGSTLKEVIRDGLVYDTKNITVVEIMGRNAGWLTAAAALAKGVDCEGVDMIFVPEVAFDIEKFIQKTAEIQKTKNNLVIAVSEGIKTSEGKYVCEYAQTSAFVDSFGHKALSGTAKFLCDKLASELGCKTRPIEFSTLQRCGAHIASATDISEAFLAGGKAVEAAANGETGKVVTFTRVSSDPYLMITDIHDVNDIANVEKCVPKEWIIEDNTNISDDFIKYARPLIQGELMPYMVDGLPAHIKL